MRQLQNKCKEITVRLYDSRFVFVFLTSIHVQIDLDWHNSFVFMTNGSRAQPESLGITIHKHNSRGGGWT